MNGPLITLGVCSFGKDSVRQIYGKNAVFGGLFQIYLFNDGINVILILAVHRCFRFAERINVVFEQFSFRHLQLERNAYLGVVWRTANEGVAIVLKFFAVCTDYTVQLIG